MKTKTFIFYRESQATKSAAISAPDFKYDFGAKIEDFQPGQTCIALIEKSDNGSTWDGVVRFELDDANEMTARQLYVEANAVRLTVTSKSGDPLLTAWMRQVN